MNCEDVLASLIDHYYSDLAARERAETAIHLSGCSSCALEYCRLDADLSGLGEMLAEAPRPEVKQALRQKVQQTFPKPWWRDLERWLRFPVPAYQAALALSAFLLAWMLLASDGRTRREAGRATATKTLIERYDSNTIPSIDPNLL
jgi:anti-sigma factor RsiW